MPLKKRQVLFLCLMIYMLCV